MKKILPAIAIAAALTGCADKTAFDVTLPVPEDFKGQTVVILNSINGDTLGLATATDSIITIKGNTEKPVLATAICNSIPLEQFVVEPGSIKVTDGLASGTPSNDQFAKLTSELQNNEDMADSLMLDFMRTYPANPYTVPVFQQNIFIADVALIDTIVALNPDFQGNPQIQKLRQAAQTRELTSTGGKYIDFSVAQPDGKTLSLGQYVNNARLTIVDFWASWCPPCRAEIPNLISLYNSYRNKGLEVVGVDVWERQEGAGQKAAADEKIPYPVIYNGSTDQTDLYGIIGIPTILVIDNQGNILARDIRGEQLADFVANYLK